MVSIQQYGFPSFFPCYRQVHRAATEVEALSLSGLVLYGRGESVTPVFFRGFRGW